LEGLELASSIGPRGIREQLGLTIGGDANKADVEALHDLIARICRRVPSPFVDVHYRGRENGVSVLPAADED
jgi:hypothetical protein